MQPQIVRHQAMLKKENTALLIIDIQDKILRVVLSPDELLANTIKLIQGFKILGLPIFITEQYPAGLGLTNGAILNELTGIQPIEKITFSCAGAENLFLTLKQKNIQQVVVCGIETHVCVLQTVLDLAANKFYVHLAADSVSSRKESDYKIALERMRQHRIEISSVETILFELLSVSGSEEFKQISRIIK